MICTIDIYHKKQSRRAIISFDESNGAVFNVIDTLVIDIYRPTQTDKTLFDAFF